MKRVISSPFFSPKILCDQMFFCLSNSQAVLGRYLTYTLHKLSLLFVAVMAATASSFNTPLTTGEKSR